VSGGLRRVESARVLVAASIESISCERVKLFRDCAELHPDDRGVALLAAPLGDVLTPRIINPDDAGRGGRSLRDRFPRFERRDDSGGRELSGAYVPLK
jgi:hypothetical protein